MRTALAVALSLAIGGVASAAERAPVPHAPVPTCKPLDVAMSEAVAKLPGVKFSNSLSVGQFHVAQGIYLGMPNTPDGLPPADSAILGVVPGKGAVLFWVRGGKACGNIFMPMSVVSILQAIHTGKLEEAPISPPDDSEDERKL